MIKNKELEAKNDWWLNDKYKIMEADLPKRELYDEIVNNLSHSLILNIVGLRRVGKSTVLKQIASKLLNDGVKKKNIFYYNFDYGAQLQKEEFLDEVLTAYMEGILKKAKYYPDEKVYIFLDEIQYIDNWQSVLKRFYDLSSKNIKFIITGSQSLLLKNKYRESLAGRIFDFYLPPMSFREFMSINNEHIKLAGKFDLYDMKDIFSDLSGYNTFYGQKIVDFAKEYITVGQFPEMRNIEAIEKKHDYIIESVIGKVLEDCVRIFNIEKPNEFKLVNNQLLHNIGSVFELKNIGAEAGVSFLTVEKYLEYLKESYVIEALYKYHKSLIKRGRILKKAYTPCINFTCAINRFRPDHVEEVPQAFGKIIENVIYNVLRQKYPKTIVNEPLSFWRKGEKEIDFIVSKRITIPNEKVEILPIEVKFSNNISFKDLAVLTDYIKKNKLKYGIVVTRNEIAQKEINGAVLYFIPYYLMLLMI
ncbi:MAG: ATP-binding protein [bacterium]